MKRRFLVLAMLIAAAACGQGEETGPVLIAAIGEQPDLADPDRVPPDDNAAMLLQATAQGLVRLDPQGEIEAGLAARWTVLDEGRTYIFRIDDIEWPDGTAVTAGEVARRLRNATRAGSGNRLAPLLSDIEEINAVTPFVIELVLRRPRTDLLRLLAQPEMAFWTTEGGVGPLAPLSDDRDGIDLVRYGTSADPEVSAVRPLVELEYAPPAMAVALFELGRVDLVAGGGWTTLPYAEAIRPDAAQLQIDPVEGLFGLQVVEFDGFLAEPENRRVLALAIDRQRLAAMLDRPEAEPRSLIIAPSAQGVGPYQMPGWIEADMDRRRAFARTAIASWEDANGEIPPLRIALPDEAGSRPIFAVIATDWGAIGLDVERVPFDGDADLRLVDRVAATDRGTWYFNVFRCDANPACSEEYEAALDLFAENETPGVGVLATAKAARALQDSMPFIPLLRPIRWWLVSSRLTGFETNAYASHPLDQLIAASGD
ncbi:ABC transporter substrate-binding protein [uncultured Parasphingopyxis sp.]|uniref:ABC transporter substrate-binding protein n=1 Tax=uncultured Parasphingopyxis sp. TaxID=1547918 RepID=UPI00263954DD|nr:ABC transporter substrate-binding protein [uncultured Parasphingopyxis sp.]